MPDSSVRKNNIVLSDYNFQRDIDNRLVMAELSVFEVIVIKEILESSLQFSVKQLANALKVAEKTLIPVLKKLAKTKLVSGHEDPIIVDKDIRKYYEFQMMKFDNDFEPGMEFLQGILSKVPIHVLPNWYSIPCTSNKIFTAIVENYLHTPKIYQRYLQGLKLHDEAMAGIMYDVFDAPGFKLCAKKLIQKYDLSREKFEELMLLLEYNIVCCLGYSQEDDSWEEVVMPFDEWRAYLQFEHDTKPKPIANSAAIKKETEKGSSEFAHSLYRKIMMGFRDKIENSTIYADKDIREIERSLKRVATVGWIYFDDFMKGFTAPIGKIPPVTLQNKGKKWKYVLPTYTTEEIAFVKMVIFECLAKAGVVEIGTNQNRPCFCVTPFGHQHLDG